jgi:S1-C subfamily serine protease
MTGFSIALRPALQITVALLMVAVISNISAASIVNAQIADVELTQKVVLIERARGGGLPPEIGAGFFVTPSGHILTAAHVLLNSDETDDVLRTRTVRIKLKSGSRYTARLLLLNRIVDLALLKIKVDTPTPYLSLGKSRTVNAGDLLTMVGHPTDGAEWDVSSGNIERITSSEHIHVRATLKPGNSGGPALNTEGIVVGVVSYRDEGGELSYLVPIDDARVLLAGVIVHDTAAGKSDIENAASTQGKEFQHQFQNDILKAGVVFVARDENRNLTISLLLENLLDQELGVLLPYKDDATAIDNKGHTYGLRRVQGIVLCNNSRKDNCYDPKLTRYTMISAKSMSNVIFSLYDQTPGQPSGDVLSFASDILALVDGKARDVSIGIWNISLDQE